MSTDKHEEVAIKVSGLHKTFRIPLDGGMNLKQNIVNIFRRRKGYREFSPLNGIDFEIKKGDFFGIVGRNGSGKSTLLKTIAGIYTPDRGGVEISGTLVPFIELGVGFNPELTGRENVYLNGALLGFGRAEMDEMYDDIVEFAELEEFMDEQLKNFSSGMQVRLAFSIAIRAEGDILLLDEVLAVGDAAFQQKCYDYFEELKEADRTVVLVTHSMSAVQRFCTAGLLLNDGEVEYIGSSEDVALKYDQLFIKERTNKEQAAINEKPKSKEVERKLLQIENVRLFQRGVESTHLRAYEDFVLSVTLISDIAISPSVVGINILNSNKQIVLAVNTNVMSTETVISKGKTTFNFSIENIFSEDVFTVNVAVEGGASRKLLLKEKGVKAFDITGIKYSKHSLTHPRVDIEVLNEK